MMATSSSNLEEDESINKASINIMILFIYMSTRPIFGRFEIGISQ